MVIAGRKVLYSSRLQVFGLTEIERRAGGCGKWKDKGKKGKGKGKGREGIGGGGLMGVNVVRYYSIR